MKTRIITFTPGVDHGYAEAAAITDERMNKEGTIVEVREDGEYSEIWCEEGFEEEATKDIQALVSVIDILSPAADSFISKERKALRNYQALIFGNLQCIEPPLEPYKE